MGTFIQNFIDETIFLFLEISPYLIVGFFFAGVVHTLLGESYIKKHFSKSGIASTVKATILGIPLPICSCGVIPIAESLRKDGASKSSVMSFLVSTPSSGVDSIFATYALMGPVFAIFRPIASLISGIIVGIATHFNEKESETYTETGKEAKKEKNFKDAFVYGFKVLPSEIAQWLLAGVVVGGLISALIPHDFAATYLSTPFLHYFVILLISVPLYVCATGSIPIAASLLMKGILPGAVLAFLIAGPATNTVTLSFVWKRLGKKVAVIYLISIVLTSIVLGVIFDLLTGEFNITQVSAHAHAESGPGLITQISGILLMLLLINSRYDLFRLFKKNKEGNMEKIKVSDMTCNHCKMTITNTLKSVQGIGKFVVLIDEKEVRYDGVAGLELVKDKIREAGFKPE
ncbi:MAG: permease [Candidatus Aminicenantes bacterium]|nr:permease [Candidatus Aminicenantes bacterium]